MRKELIFGLICTVGFLLNYSVYGQETVEPDPYPLLSKAKQYCPICSSMKPISQLDRDKAAALNVQYAKENPTAYKAPMALAHAGMIYLYGTNLELAWHPDLEKGRLYLGQAIEMTPDRINKDLISARTNYAGLNQNQEVFLKEQLEMYIWLSNWTEKRIQDAVEEECGQVLTKIFDKDGNVTYEPYTDHPELQNSLEDLIKQRVDSITNLLESKLPHIEDEIVRTASGMNLQDTNLDYVMIKAIGYPIVDKAQKEKKKVSTLRSQNTAPLDN